MLIKSKAIVKIVKIVLVQQSVISQIAIHTQSYSPERKIIQSNWTENVMLSLQ
jgi:hypothetical protein